jgi:hypothetical protein
MAGLLGATSAAWSSESCEVDTPAAFTLHLVCLACLQEGGSTPDGSTSGSSSDEDNPVQLSPQQQQQAADAERKRKQADALRRMNAATVQLRRNTVQRNRATGSAMIDTELQIALSKVQYTKQVQ